MGPDLHDELHDVDGGAPGGYGRRHGAGQQCKTWAQRRPSRTPPRSCDRTCHLCHRQAWPLLRSVHLSERRPRRLSSWTVRRAEPPPRRPLAGCCHREPGWLRRRLLPTEPTVGAVPGDGFLVPHLRRDPRSLDGVRAGFSLKVLLAPVAVLLAGLAFWYGPSTLASCDGRPALFEHYGHVDGPGGAGVKSCLAPSTANYVITAVVFTLTLIVAAVGDWVRTATSQPRSRSKTQRPRVFLDAAGNRVEPPPDA
jgi:hypothetical protein